VKHPLAYLDELKIMALEGAAYCYNEECEVVGHLKDFKVCPQCNLARYCGRRVSETGLDNGRAQGKVWHRQVECEAFAPARLGSAGRRTC
jgi:hypothetical protein